MSDVTTKRCDASGCGRMKQEANHWFRCFVNGPAIEFGMDSVQFTADVLGSRMGTPPQVGHVKDICGEDCAHKLLSEWFQQQREPGAREG
jgi:hypothetical protein